MKRKSINPVYYPDFRTVMREARKASLRSGSPGFYSGRLYPGGFVLVNDLGAVRCVDGRFRFFKRPRNMLLPVNCLDLTSQIVQDEF